MGPVQQSYHNPNIKIVSVWEDKKTQKKKMKEKEKEEFEKSKEYKIEYNYVGPPLACDFDFLFLLLGYPRYVKRGEKWCGGGGSGGGRREELFVSQNLLLFLLGGIRGIHYWCS